MLQGTLIYPGLSGVINARYTFTHGTRPDVITVDVKPQPLGDLSQRGAAVLKFSDNTIILKDSAVDFASLQLSTHGHFERVRILDRRWKWQSGGEVNGMYNYRFANQTLDTNLEKTPQELASILLRAMGESRFDVSALPIEPRPFVRWVCAHPATELDHLCDRYGCRVVLGLNDDPVRIVRLGVGNAIPNDSDVVSVGFGVDPPELPDSIKVCCGPTVFQSRLLLEPVGLNTNNTVDVIDELDILPSGETWEALAADWDFTGITTLAHRKLAKKCVFRWYRIKSQADGSMDVPGIVDNLQSGNVDSISELPGGGGGGGGGGSDPEPNEEPPNPEPVDGIWQWLPLRPTLVSTYEDSEGITHEKEPFVESDAAWSAGVKPEVIATDAGRVDVPFRLDLERGIVQFATPVYSLDTTDDTVKRPHLFLTCSYHVKHRISRLFHRYYVKRNLRATPIGTGPKVINQKELQVKVEAEYVSDDASNVDDDVDGNVTGGAYTEVDGTTSNRADVFNEADLLITSQALEYQVARATTVHYRGLKPIRLDGLTRQVTWTCNKWKGAFTSAAMNSETDPYVLPFHRQLELIQRRHRRQAAREADETPKDPDGESRVK